MQASTVLKPVTAVVAALVISSAFAQDAGRTLTPSELKWRALRTDGLEIATVMGEQSKPGPVITRVKFPPNFTMPAHTHADDRTYTILSGTWYVGWGTTFDETKLKALPAGSFYTEPANVPHFVATKGDGAVVQISGTGPASPPRFVDPPPPAK